MLTDRASATLLAVAPLAAMLADPASATLLAAVLAAAVLADPASAAFLASVLAAAVLADRGTTALSAGVPLAVVVAEQMPVAVAALCTAALGITAAALVVTVDTSASAAPAVEAATEMPRQTVEQILLLPGLRQLKLGAHLLQLSHVLRARGQTHQT